MFRGWQWPVVEQKGTVMRRRGGLPRPSVSQAKRLNGGGLELQERLSSII